MKPVPPEPPKPQVITIPPTPVVQKVGEPDTSIPMTREEEPPVLETWYTDEAEIKRLQSYSNLAKAIEDAVKKNRCLCMPGDPLCSCL